MDIKTFCNMIKQKSGNRRGDTALLKFGGEEYHGDAQVLAGVFKFHQQESKAPPLTNKPEDQLYKQATIDVASIHYILKSRGWKLPIVSTDQTEILISRLKNNSAPDYYNINAEYIKNGAVT